MNLGKRFLILDDIIVPYILVSYSKFKHYIPI